MDMSSQFKTLLLLATLSGIVIALGGILGGRGGLLIAFCIAILMNIGSYWFSDSIVLKMYHAREQAPEDAPWLHDIVAHLATSARVPKPRIYIVPEQAPNAFATGRDPEHSAIAVTEGILGMLSPEELEGVLAHEMGHIVNRDILIQTIAGVMASVIVMLANMFQFQAIFGGNRNGGAGNAIGALLLALLAPMAAGLIQMAISRSREYLADETGARLCGQPLQLAGALYKLGQASGQIPLKRGNPSTGEMFIVAPLFGRDASIAKFFSTHPPLRDRIERLRQMAANQ